MAWPMTLNLIPTRLILTVHKPEPQPYKELKKGLVCNLKVASRTLTLKTPPEDIRPNHRHQQDHQLCLSANQLIQEE